MNAKVTLQSFDAQSAPPLLPDLVRVYLDVYRDAETEFHGEDRYRQQLAGHMRAPGWKLVTATIDGELVGYAYGFPLPPTTRWWEGMQTPVPAGFTNEDGRRTFAISEILVRQPWRRRGIARQLHDQLLEHRPEPRATLLVEPDNTAAQAAYASWGWEKVAGLVPHWDNAPFYNVLVLPLTVG